MNFAEVIESLVCDKGLSKEAVVAIVQEGMLAAYAKKYPDIEFQVNIDPGTCDVKVLSQVTVTSGAATDVSELSVRKARMFAATVQVGDEIFVPFEGEIGRIEVQVAKRVIADGVRELEQAAVYEAFKGRVDTLITGTVHKRERAGYAINLGEAFAFLPNSCSGFDAPVRSGDQVRAVIKEVLPFTETGYQIVLDRAGPQFLLKLLELEIPEIFEGIVEIVKIERIAGYKTKMVVSSKSKNIDAVGACIGVGGSRIRPILQELNGEKIDVIPHTEDMEQLVKSSLKPAEIKQVEISSDGARADVWVEADQKAMVIGKQGNNISLASKITGLAIQLHSDDDESVEKEDLFSVSDAMDAYDKQEEQDFKS